MSQNASYHVDLALCIDATGSMGSIIDRVKSSALVFHDRLMAEMKKKDKYVDVLRVRVVAFRDYYADDEPILESPFFTLPAEQDAFKSFVSNITADGGGDDPENGLEALALAMKSQWTKEGAKRRHVIVVWTDANAHPLDKPGKPASYPSDMPKNFDELTDMWEETHMQGSAKRLVLFARESAPWSDIGVNWNQVVLYPSKAGEGLQEIDLEVILELIASSV